MRPLFKACLPLLACLLATAWSASAAHPDTLSIVFIGDVMCHAPQCTASLLPGGDPAKYDDYDFSGFFAHVKDRIRGADLAVANLEFPCGVVPYTGYPHFSAPRSLAEAAAESGVDVFLTANNHICDKGRPGMDSTYKIYSQMGVPFTGLYRSQGEEYENNPLIVNVRGVNIALINFTYSTNGIPVPAPFVVNMQDTTEIAADLKTAKSFDPDVIIAFPHWGIEYAQLPNKEQRNLVDWMLRNGVDHVIGGHPHVIQPFEVVNQGGKEHLVVYSLGNYVSNMTKINTDGGAMVRMTLTKQGGKTVMSACDYSLVFVSRPNTSGKKNFRIFPVKSPDDELNAADRNLRTRFINSTRALLGKHNKGIKER